MYPKYDRSLTLEDLKELFEYDLVKGGLIGKLKICKRRAKPNNGYVCWSILGYRYPEHHLVWLWFKGEFPPVRITLDHKNRVKSDNKIENLRLASQSQNQVNTKVRSDNALGLRGVYFHKTEKKYRATVWKDGKSISCGQFNTAEEANVIALKKRKELFGEFVA